MPHNDNPSHTKPFSPCQMFLNECRLKGYVQAYAVGRGADVEGVAIGGVRLLFDPVQAAITNAFQHDTCGYGGAACAHQRGASEVKGSGDDIIFVARHPVSGVYTPDETDSETGYTAPKEAVTGLDLLAGTDDRLFEDVETHNVDELGIRQDGTVIVHDIGAFAGILCVGILRQAKERGDDAA